MMIPKPNNHVGEWDPSAYATEAIPPRAQGKVRIGIVSPCCYLGGAERWISDLPDLCDGNRIEWAGIAILKPLGDGPNLKADWEHHCPVTVGEDGIRDLAHRVDALLTWGVVDLPWGLSAAKIAGLIPPGLPIATVMHGSTEHPGMKSTHLTEAVQFAVSLSLIHI